MIRILDAVAPRRLGPGFRWLLASSWLSNTGDGIAIAAGPLLVASLSHKTSDYRAMMIQTTVGCRFRCDFCDIIQFNGGFTRPKTLESVRA